MFSPRSILTVTALSAALVLSGCSGSDDDPKASDEPSQVMDPSALESAREEAANQFNKDCTVSVEATGAAEVSWEGEGSVTNGPGMAMYSSTEGDAQLFVYANSDAMPQTATLTIGDTTYTALDPDAGFDVAEDGSSAEIDVDTEGIAGAGPHVTATFTCKGKGKG
ncbi:hypothetical protein [Nocardioides sp. SR21]|uniref:hypothetical protein n=1 Tax=Nocardioides sp. SR21 TaxID=2919501 RepID=UPI001FAB01A7|nr:hypothetical protein [Nocardioides sp. SR21]